jgi:hypothetical protein
MKIIKLQAENVKRLRAVTVTPDPGGALVIVGGRNAQGKQQPISEPVLTPNGWVKIGDLRVGDNVVGVRGRAIRVTAVHR